MPANKNALTRIVLLDKLLADRYHSYSIQDMTDYLEREPYSQLRTKNYYSKIY